MKKFTLAAATLLGAMIASPSIAATSGNIVDLSGAGFSYGTLVGGTFNPYTFYAAGSSQCLTLTSDCYRGDDTYAIVGLAANGQLLVHPAPGSGGNSVVRFTPIQTGLYQLTATGTSADTGLKTVGYFTTIGGVTTVFPSGQISGTLSQQISSTAVVLGASDSIGIIVDNTDGYFNDSTNFVGRISAVPEPATWAMMLLGFGMVGFGLRRRAGKVSTRVAFG